MREANHYSQNEAIVWKAFKAGSESAFDYLYDTYFNTLYSYSLQLCPDKALVKDCIQNLFIELWHNKANLADVQYIKYYLYKAIRRKIVKELSLEKKYFHPEDVTENYTFEVSFSHEFLLITEQISQENQQKLLKAFDSLTKRQKEAIFLRFYGNMEYEQIASIMALKEVKYARTLIYRALDVLKTSIRSLVTIE